MPLLGMDAKEETESINEICHPYVIAALITANLGITQDVHQ